jgi:Tol biopolymer transport system component
MTHKKMHRRLMRSGLLIMCIIEISAIILSGCGDDKTTNTETKEVPHQEQWGIYALNLADETTSLLYSSADQIVDINLSHSGNRIAFSVKTQPAAAIDSTSEIYILNIDSGVATRITDNGYFDAYPSFSPDDSSIVFLSMRATDLDLYMMKSDGTDQHLLYNSGGHDGDVDWGDNGRIVFTRNYQIWSIDSLGGNPVQQTDPPGAGTWGDADLPIGDYDPRLSPDGNTIAFERMVDVSYTHGGYDIFIIGVDGNGLTNLTNNGSQGYAQGFPNWSQSGDRLVYVVSAVGTEGKYDMWMINADGSNNHSITPGYYPALFLIRNVIFSADDSKIYFIGQWWQ